VVPCKMRGVCLGCVVDLAPSSGPGTHQPPRPATRARRPATPDTIPRDTPKYPKILPDTSERAEPPEPPRYIPLSHDFLRSHPAGYAC